MRKVLDRRTFVARWVAAGVAALGLASLARPRPVRGAGALYSPLGIQLYTLRSLLADDLEGTLDQVARIGYEEVELAGLYGLGAAEMRTALDRVGLRAASSHVGLDVVRDAWPQALADARALGQRWLVCPSLPGSVRTPDGYRRVADDFNRAGEAAREAGLRFAYHNHDFEFAPLGDGSGSSGYDVLVARCDPELVSLQLDVFWAVHAGEDPLAWFRAHPGRFTSIHAKDRTADGQMVAVGRGVIDFASVLAAAPDAGVEHVFVEHDRPDDPLEVARTSYETLAAIPTPTGDDARPGANG